MSILPDHVLEMRELEHKMDRNTFYQIGNLQDGATLSSKIFFHSFRQMSKQT